jgi:serine/threonine protein kinase
MSLTTLKRLYRVSKSLKTPGTQHRPDDRQTQVTGVTSFICLALELEMVLFSDPLNAYISPSRAGDGGSFSVSQFGLQFDDLGYTETDVYRDGKTRRGAWLSKGDKIVTKHISAGNISGANTSLDDTAVLRPLVQEMRVLAHAPLRDHKNIVDILGVAWEPRLDFFGRCWPVMVLEYAHCGNLTQFFSLQHTELAWDSKLKLTADIVEGLSALHECGVIHGDLKGDNVLIAINSDGELVAKLSDFGFAIIEADYPESHVVDIPGFTPEWAAPEARAGTLPLKRAFLLDMYSFGLVFAFLILDGIFPISIHVRYQKPSPV